MTNDIRDRARTIIAARYICRACDHEVVRHFFSVKDYNKDIMAQNLLCQRCYLEERFEPGTLVPHDQLPVTPYPRQAPKKLDSKEILSDEKSGGNITGNSSV